MKKWQKSTPAPDLDLKSLIHEHSLFFDKLIELIPARFYLPVEDKEKPWFQGLSKAAKASAKKESKENIKKSRRARLDPEKSSTTLEILHKTIEKEKSAETTNEESGKEAVLENIPDSKDDNRSVTYEELRERLHRRIEEFRSNRNAGPSSKDKIEKKRDFQGKRKRDTESKQTKSDSVKTDQSQSPSQQVSEELAFGHVKLGNEDGRNKKRKLSKPQTLEKAKRLEEAKKDPEKGDIVSKKHSWKAAATRAAGIKVHDDPKLLKESMKKEKKKHQKNAEKWKERIQSRDKTRAEKQNTRAGNIADRIQQKKMRRIAKREKKLMRPGFEGRKDGFINATFEENSCNRGGYCNFMHVKQIGRELRRKLFGRYHRSQGSRSRSRSFSPGHRRESEWHGGRGRDNRDRGDHRRNGRHGRYEGDGRRRRSPRRNGGSPVREGCEERRARIEQWNRERENH